MAEFDKVVGFEGHDDFPVVQAVDIVDHILEGQHAAPGLEVAPDGFTYIMTDSGGHLSSTRRETGEASHAYSLLHFHSGVMSRVDVVRLGALAHPSYSSNELPHESPAIKATVALGSDLGIF